MKIENMRELFFRISAWSWFVLGVVGIGFEMWRPGFVQHLIPVFVFFVLAFIFGLFSHIQKKL